MSLQACGDLVSRGDPARFRAAMAAPVATRRVLLPIYAANIEISRAPWVTQEHLIAEMRLQWWRDALGEVKSGTPRRHEVVDELAGILPDAGTDLLLAAIDARAWDIYREPFQTAEGLMDYTTPTTLGPMGAAFLALGGATDQMAMVKGLATGLGVARFLQAYVDVRAAAGKEVCPEWDADYIAMTATLGLNVFQRCKKQFDKRHPASAALIEAAGADRFLKHIIRNPANVQDGSVPGFAFQSAISRAVFAWRLRPVP